MTENPTREFVRPQVVLFSESTAKPANLSHDNAPMFNLDLLGYDLVSVTTAVDAPNMNSKNGAVLQVGGEADPDNCLLFGRDKIQGVVEEDVDICNAQRQPQGIRQRIPTSVEADRTRSPIHKRAVLGGLHHHCFRQAARQTEYPPMRGPAIPTTGKVARDRARVGSSSRVRYMAPPSM